MYSQGVVALVDLVQRIAWTSLATFFGLQPLQGFDQPLLGQ